MKKKWFYSVAMIGLIAVLLIPLMGFSSTSKGQTKIKPNLITLKSGGIGVPLDQVPAELYHQPLDGIISGAIGCQPDVHVFDKSNTAMGPFGPETEHIVFTAGVAEIPKQKIAEAIADKFTIYVEITSNGQKVLELPFRLHQTPDPNTGKPFWVSALYFEGDIQGKGRTAVNLPTGEYSYKFKAKVINKNGPVLDVWVPKNHKFTIIDSSTDK
jgi:hypothetical protein